MGDVVFFTRSERPARSREGETAQILFFTGVRYERMIEAPRPNNTRPSSAGGLGAKRRRKRC